VLFAVSLRLLNPGNELQFSGSTVLEFPARLCGLERAFAACSTQGWYTMNRGFSLFLVFFSGLTAVHTAVAMQLAAGGAQASPVASSPQTAREGVRPLPAMAGSAANTVTRLPRAERSNDQYVIGAGDILEVIVWKEQDASVPSITVRTDGRITLPFIKEVEVAGFTPPRVEEQITARLKPFINEPDVTVIVREVHSKRIYLVGAVKKEGTIDLKYPMTVLQALSEAGGLTEYAKRKKIYILRTDNGKRVQLPFNYDAVIRGQQMQQNIPVLPDDTIVVPH
jgi:polysaccharide biosynthesis/export protein